MNLEVIKDWALQGAFAQVTELQNQLAQLQAQNNALTHRNLELEKPQEPKLVGSTQFEFINTWYDDYQENCRRHGISGDIHNDALWLAMGRDYEEFLQWMQLNEVSMLEKSSLEHCVEFLQGKLYGKQE